MLGVGRKNHHRNFGKAPLVLFWSQNRLIPCLLTISHLSGGDLFITSLGQKDKRLAPICQGVNWVGYHSKQNLAVFLGINVSAFHRGFLFATTIEHGINKHEKTKHRDERAEIVASRALVLWELFSSLRDNIL